MGYTCEVKVAKEHIVGPSDLDPPGQDQYEYFAYTFTIDDRVYEVRRYVGDDHATIVSTVRDSDDQARSDAESIARHLIDSEGVARVYRYDTSTGGYGCLVAAQ